ncbi:MAG: D-2-hydroxyacid dehydrogenase, partial [Polyangiales bacterium]
TPHTILINAELPEFLIARIREAAPKTRVLTQRELSDRPELWRETEVLLTQHVAPARLAEATDLRWIQTAGAGVDWLLVPEVVARKELTITNASGVHPDQIAEHSLMLILALTRRLPRVFAQQREQRWDAEPFRFNIPTLKGRTLGILGVGAIGLRLAQLGAAFGLRVIGSRRSAEPAPHVERIYGPDQLDELLTQSDYLVNALPLTAATRKLLGARELALLPRDAIVINIGRGPTIDTDALVAALRSGHLGGAGLDVTDPEPLPSAHPLWHLDNTIITPHYSGGHPTYLQQVTQIFLDNLQHYAQDKPLQNRVDVHAGY